MFGRNTLDDSCTMFLFRILVGKSRAGDWRGRNKKEKIA